MSENLVPYFAANRSAYKEIYDKLNHDEKRSFDNYLIGALFVEVNPASFLDCLKAAKRCIETAKKYNLPLEVRE